LLCDEPASLRGRRRAFVADILLPGLEEEAKTVDRALALVAAAVALADAVAAAKNIEIIVWDLNNLNAGRPRRRGDAAGARGKIMDNSSKKTVPQKLRRELVRALNKIMDNEAVIGITLGSLMVVYLLGRPATELR
jgi:hypothetical protein